MMRRCCSSSFVEASGRNTQSNCRLNREASAGGQSTGRVDQGPPRSNRAGRQRPRHSSMSWASKERCSSLPLVRCCPSTASASDHELCLTVLGCDYCPMSCCRSLRSGRQASHEPGCPTRQLLPFASCLARSLPSYRLHTMPMHRQGSSSQVWGRASSYRCRFSMPLSHAIMGA